MRKIKLFLTIVIVLCIGFASGFASVSLMSYPKDNGDVYISGNLKIHFLELGNANTGDCVLINQGDKHFLFTGDLEKSGEEYLVELNDLPEVELFKAGHHGSVTSSNDVLLSAIKPKYIVVCCCAGNSEYTSNKDNQFPSQAFINRVSLYTEMVYVTSIGAEGYTGEGSFASFNGNIVFTSSKKGIKVECSNNNIILKNSEWFLQNRVIPDKWQENSE